VIRVGLGGPGGDGEGDGGGEKGEDEAGHWVSWGGVEVRGGPPIAPSVAR
jgi:hypothetical protein